MDLLCQLKYFPCSENVISIALPDMKVFIVASFKPKKGQPDPYNKVFAGAYVCPFCFHSYQTNDEGKIIYYQCYMFEILAILIGFEIL